jgi:acetyl esterase/lipase
MKKFFLRAGGLLLILAFSACVDALNATIPDDGYTVEKNIAYGDKARQHLDIYRPDNPAPGAPVIVFVYGGRWETGSKEDYLFAGQAFASKGYTVVIADYRLYPEVHFPVFIEDAAAAFVWTHRHIADYGGNPKNIFMAGHSAGAYIALMLAADTSYIKKAGGEAGWIRGAIGLAGPYNFVPAQEDPDIQEIFSTAPESQTQVITFARKDMPPTFLATGDADTTVKPHNTYDLAKRLKTLGGKIEVHTYEDVAHIGLVLSLASGFRGKASVLDDIAGFVEKYGAEK